MGYTEYIYVFNRVHKINNSVHSSRYRLITMVQTSLSAGAGLGGKSQNWRLLQANGPAGDGQDMTAVLPSGSQPAQEIRQPKNNSKQRKAPPPPRSRKLPGRCLSVARGNRKTPSIGVRSR